MSGMTRIILYKSSVSAGGLLESIRISSHVISHRLLEPIEVSSHVIDGPVAQLDRAQVS